MSNENLATQLVKYAQKPNHMILLPNAEDLSPPAGWKVSIRQVQIKQTDVYQIPGTSKCGLSKVAVERIAMAAGVTWESVRRVDDRKTRHYYEYEARCKVMDFDGTTRIAIGTKVVDLTDEAAAEMGLNGKGLSQARRFGPEICASKAMLRAISSVLAVPRCIEKVEVGKVYVVPKLVPDPQCQAAGQALLQAMIGQPALPPAQTEPILEGEILDACDDDSSVVDDDEAPAADTIESVYDMARELSVNWGDALQMAGISDDVETLTDEQLQVLRTTVQIIAKTGVGQ